MFDMLLKKFKCVRIFLYPNKIDINRLAGNSVLEFFIFVVCHLYVVEDVVEKGVYISITVLRGRYSRVKNAEMRRAQKWHQN